MKGRWYVIMLSLDMFLYTKKNALKVFFYFYFPFSYFNFFFFLRAETSFELESFR